MLVVEDAKLVDQVFHIIGAKTCHKKMQFLDVNYSHLCYYLIVALEINNEKKVCSHLNIFNMMIHDLAKNDKDSEMVYLEF